MINWNQETLHKFNDTLGSDAPTPGGGAAAAVVSSISAALLLMVVSLSDNDERLEKIEQMLSEYLDGSYQLIDADCEGFAEVMKAYKLSTETSEEKKNRSNEIEKALKQASLPPENLMELSLEILTLANDLAKEGNENAWTETIIAGNFAYSAVKASYYNIIINICDIEDEDFNAEKIDAARRYLLLAEQQLEELEQYLQEEVIDCRFLP